MLLLVVYLFSISFLTAQTQPACTAIITPAGSASICQGSSLVLSANSGTGLSYQWKKDGGTTIIGTNRQLTVTTAGSYTVTVTSSGTGTTCGPTTSSPVNVTISNSTPPVQPDFSFTPSTIQCAGTPVSFTITGGAQANTSYVWDFGDGVVRSTNEPTISHAFTATAAGTPGTQNLNVSVYAYNTTTGCVSPTRVKPITVREQPQFTTPALSYKNGTGASANGSNVCLPEAETVNVTATLTNDAANTGFTTYKVDWKDGSGEQTYTAAQFNGTTTISNPRPYSELRTYLIKITATSTDPNACPVIKEIPFTVSKDPKAIIELDERSRITPPIACGVPVRVTLKNTSTGGGLTYKWEVEKVAPTQGPANFTYIEATSDTSKTPVFQFNEKGQYSIKLRVSNPCVNPSDPDGPKTPGTPEDPQSQDDDGKYVATTQVIIVYPFVRPNPTPPFCEPLDPSQKFTVTGAELATFDGNLGQIIPTSFKWSKVDGPGVVDFSNPNIDNPTITFSAAGVYKLNVNFNNDCENSDALNPQRPMEIVVTINRRPEAPTLSPITLCAGEPFTPPAGTGNISYLFYTTPTGGNPVIPNTNTAGPTTYYVAAVENDCESRTRTPLTITVVPPVSNNTIAADQTVCVDQPAAPITGSTPTGGSGTTYTYTWLVSTTGATTGFTAAPGTNNAADYTPMFSSTSGAFQRTAWYRRIVRSGSCSPDTSTAVKITVVPRITNNTISATQTICAESTPAALTGSTPTGGGGTLTYLWESSTTSATATDFAPAPGANTGKDYTPGMLGQTTYFRRRVSAGGCDNFSRVIQVTVIQAITNNTIGNDQTVCYSTTAPAELTGSSPAGGGGPGSFTYRWESSLSGGDDDFRAIPGATAQNYTPSPISATTYFRRVVTSGTTGTNCEPSFSNVVVLTLVPDIQNNTIMVSEPVVCRGSVPVFTGSNATGGNGNLVYLWETSTTGATSGFNPATGTNNTRDYTPGFLTQRTWFRRTVTSGGTNCPGASSEAIEVNVEAAPVAPTVAAENVQVCVGTSATLRVTSTGHSYEWYTSATGGTPVFFGTEYVTAPITRPTTYYVQAVSNNKCVSTTRTPVRVTTLDLTVDAGPDVEIIEGKNAVLTARVPNGATNPKYTWAPAEGLNTTEGASVIASPTKTTTYRVTVVTENGCETTDEVTITVTPRVVIVNTFSPNNDGINETWEIRNIENFPNATVEIFNRWGSQVYKAEGGYKIPWDGTFKGSMLPLATYYYVIRLNENEKPLTGSVTIIR
ncbi:T9SS C-terminal target domain-containing protein [Adhaeribacter aquaticus]|uniref:T9SS C-terminal target domain-containing protein n=1 Tax=Adhaeribacter aquaticus TaxID=299567 RepID=UPI00047CE82D|nr:T9SS C-terminal target domain-containing protein [Adhaeribacter aquaticus]